MRPSTTSADTEARTCPVMWPVGIVRGAWVHQPCGQPVEPGQRHCTDCRKYAEQERGQR